MHSPAKLAKALIILAAALTLRPALYPIPLSAGDCISDCMRYCWSGGSVSDPATCREQLHRCEISCDTRRAYGAIAYSAKDKGSGWSFRWNDQAKAEQVAVANCSERGAACKSIVWYYNSCGAVAADGNIVTWGRDATRPGAERTAMAECTKAGGKNCAVEASQCSRF